MTDDPAIANLNDPDLYPALMADPASADQLTRLLTDRRVDLTPTFLGFVGIYRTLAAIIPRHWIVIDLGCAHAIQAYYFRFHRAYMGIDLVPVDARLHTPNALHYAMTAGQFVRRLPGDLTPCFAICSFTPPRFGGEDVALITRTHFPNCFVYTPQGGPREGYRAAMEQR